MNHVIGMIAWNESPELLNLVLKSMKRCNFKIVIVDGVFADYARINKLNKFDSNPESIEVMKYYADYFIKCPKEPWTSQVVKRNAALKQVSEGDYYWAIDADEEFVYFKQLQEMTEPIYRIYEHGPDRTFSTIRVYKQQKGLHYELQHCRMYLNNELLVSAHHVNNQMQPLLLDSFGQKISIIHHCFKRDKLRQEQKQKFYAERTERLLGYAQ